MLRIVQVNKQLSAFGGIERHFYALCQLLASQPDLEVHALVCRPGLKSFTVKEDGFKVSYVASTPKIMRMPVAPTFPLWLRSLSADIFHFHHPFPLAELSYILTAPKGAVVVTWHSDVVRQRRVMLLYRPLLQRFLARTDRIIVTSPNLMQSSKFLTPYRNKCRVIPLGVDTSLFEPTSITHKETEAIRACYGSRIVLYVGKLRYYKGLEYLIAAMQQVRAVLLVVGEGPEELRLRRVTRQLGLEGRVRFLPHMQNDKLVSFFHACDVFVLPSIERSEAFGIVQLEAMASGKPVVSTNLATGVPFVNQHGLTGYVVPPRDATALAESVNRLLEDNELRNRMGENGKHRVRREFELRHMVERIRNVYAELA